MSEPQPPAVDLERLLARLDELRRAERRAASARMVSVIGHLIGTPLNVIAGRAGLIRNNPAPEAIEENVRRIEEQVERLSRRIRRLVDYFSLVDPRGESRSLADVLAECRELYAPIAQRQGVVLELSSGELGEQHIEGSFMPVVLTALLSLAIDTTASGGKVALSASERGPRVLVLELGMAGLAVPPGRLDRLEPPEPEMHYDVGAFETLWICQGLARRISGSLEVVPAAAGHGVTVHLECPHT
ncbi:MAG TPA: histidine kinase dimerization/phospho-acceptor domain-containing protein [Polyangiaceae bacterium]|nr:histidine kinase dimerization/phospho-acceptor domain-containing protein [Polyangiaceae bacterium]